MVQSSPAHREWFTVDQSSALPDEAQRVTDLGLTLAPADYQDLLEELKQAQVLDRERIARIHELEQALDQSLVCLEDLRAQLNDQHILENQLATTEEFSHVQQQAIARLKLQLAEQQQVLDAQVLETQQRDQAIQELMATIESMTQAQQQELERLRSYIAQDQVEVHNHRHLLEQQIQELHTTVESRQHRISELESETLAARTLTTSLREQLATAQQQIKELSVRLRQHQADWAQLETQLAEAQQERTHAASKASGLSLPLQRHSSTESTGTIATIQQDLNRSHRRIELLESQLAQHAKLHAQWQQSHQQLEDERDGLQTRVTNLEQQNAEMQEQILHQAQQATEYETAVQYWKDRCASSQRHMGQLRELLEQAQQHPSSSSDPALVELFNTLLAAIPADTQEPPSTNLAVPPRFTPELPDFLVRRRDRAREKGSGIRN